MEILNLTLLQPINILIIGLMLLASLWIYHWLRAHVSKNG